MDSQEIPSIRSFFPLAFILSLIGWGGLIYLVINTLPAAGPRWLFFFLSVLAITGTALLPVAFLNRRFPSNPPATHGIILREAIWVAVYVPTLAWLQLSRVLTPALALLLALGLFIIEGLLRLRERSRWQP